MTDKECTQCGRSKPLNGYYENHLRGDGRTTQCKQCYRDKANAAYRLDVQAGRERNKEWRRRNPNVIWANNLKKYGVSLDDYLEMFQKQGGVCYICRNPETALSRNGSVARLAIDHCHVSGAVRSLLCASCNKFVAILERQLAPILVAVADGRMVDAVQLYDVLPHWDDLGLRYKFRAVLVARYGYDEAHAILTKDFHAARVMLDAEYQKIRARQNAEAQIVR